MKRTFFHLSPALALKPPPKERFNPVRIYKNTVKSSTNSLSKRRSYLDLSFVSSLKISM